MNEQIFIFDGKKNKEIVREMTDAEQAERDEGIAEYLAKKAAKEKEENEKAEARKALLNRLAITEEEAKLLLG